MAAVCSTRCRFLHYPVNIFKSPLVTDFPIKKSLLLYCIPLPQTWVESPSKCVNIFVFEFFLHSFPSWTKSTERSLLKKWSGYLPFEVWQEIVHKYDKRYRDSLRTKVIIAEYFLSLILFCLSFSVFERVSYNHSLKKNTFIFSYGLFIICSLWVHSFRSGWVCETVRAHTCVCVCAQVWQSVWSWICWCVIVLVCAHLIMHMCSCACVNVCAQSRRPDHRWLDGHSL